MARPIYKITATTARKNPVLTKWTLRWWPPLESILESIIHIRFIFFFYLMEIIDIINIINAIDITTQLVSFEGNWQLSMECSFPQCHSKCESSKKLMINCYNQSALRTTRKISLNTVQTFDRIMPLL